MAAALSRPDARSTHRPRDPLPTPTSLTSLTPLPGRTAAIKRARVGLSIAAWLLASVAAANGRFPRAQRLVESADDPHVLALYGTYGLLVTNDAGRSWSHVCEAATGTYTGEDPLLELLPGGRIVARTETALVRSGDTWCNWNTALDGTKNSIQDITRDPSLPSTVLALLGAFDAQTGFVSLLVESPDAGTSWSSPKELPRDQITRGLSLDVAPSSPMRVLVSGLDKDGKGRLLVSDDRGGSFQGHALGTTDSNSAPYLAAISKTDENRIFVRTDAYRDIGGIDTANDALLLSVDGGVTWATLIERKAKLLGFALSPDESTLLVGYGDPVESATAVEPADLGIYRANLATILADPANAADKFLKIFDASVTCLRFTASGLFACTSQGERGFELGRAPSAAFALSNPQPFEPRLLLPNVRPLACGPGTDAYACYTDPDNGFPAVCGVLQASCDASAPPPSMRPDGGVVGPGALDASSGGRAQMGGDAGRSSSSATGGRPGEDAGAGLVSPSPPPPPPGDGNLASCACHTAPAHSTHGLGGASAIVVLIAGLFRRARRFALGRGSNPR